MDANTSSAARWPALLDQVRQALPIRPLSQRTERPSIARTKRFVPFHRERHGHGQGKELRKGFSPVRPTVSRGGWPGSWCAALGPLGKPDGVTGTTDGRHCHALEPVLIRTLDPYTWHLSRSPREEDRVGQVPDGV